MSTFQLGARRPVRPTITIAALGLVGIVAAVVTHQLYSEDTQAVQTSPPGGAAKSDFWERPGARSIGNEAMPTTPAVSPQAAGSLAAIHGAQQALSRPLDVKVDGSGHLRMDRALRNKLDDSIGWVDGAIPVEAVERARQKLRQELHGSVLTDALAALDRYVAYRNAAQEQARAGATPTLPPNLSVLGDVVQLQRRMALRSQMLDENMRREFFGDDDALDRYRLTLLQLQSMPSLSEAERGEQLRPLWQQLPPHLRSQIPAP